MDSLSGLLGLPGAELQCKDGTHQGPTRGALPMGQRALVQVSMPDLPYSFSHSAAQAAACNESWPYVHDGVFLFAY